MYTETIAKLMDCTTLKESQMVYGKMYFYCYSFHVFFFNKTIVKDCLKKKCAINICRFVAGDNSGYSWKYVLPAGGSQSRVGGEQTVILDIRQTVDERPGDPHPGRQASAGGCMGCSEKRRH